jgi:hypothetical protein
MFLRRHQSSYCSNDHACISSLEPALGVGDSSPLETHKLSVTTGKDLASESRPIRASWCCQAPTVQFARAR